MGLLLLRLTLSAYLLEFVFTSDSAIAGLSLAVAAALLIAIGLWTPIAGVLTAVTLIWTAISNHHLWPCLLVAAIGIALSLVGPGAFSVDGYHYGRKRVIFDDSRK